MVGTALHEPVYRVERVTCEGSGYFPPISIRYADLLLFTSDEVSLLYFCKNNFKYSKLSFI